LNCGGYDDWFLPSGDELKAIWDNLVDDGTGANSGAGDFVAAAGWYYWSSSELKLSGYEFRNAYYQSFADGSSGNRPKDQYCYVRAVRAF
jgi:hypothetical protein